MGQDKHKAAMRWSQRVEPTPGWDVVANLSVRGISEVPMPLVTSQRADFEKCAF